LFLSLVCKFLTLNTRRRIVENVLNLGGKLQIRYILLIYRCILYRWRPFLFSSRPPSKLYIASKEFFSLFLSFRVALSYQRNWRDSGLRQWRENWLHEDLLEDFMVSSYNLFKRERKIQGGLKRMLFSVAIWSHFTLIFYNSELYLTLSLLPPAQTENQFLWDVNSVDEVKSFHIFLSAPPSPSKHSIFFLVSHFVLKIFDSHILGK
jgi:hypothetical protein